MELRQKLYDVTAGCLSVLRTGEKLDRGLQEIKQLREALGRASLSTQQRKYNREWMDYLHLRNGIITAGATILAASLRKESRGVHVREDFCCTDNIKYLKNLVITDCEGGARWEDPVHTAVQPELVCRDYIPYVEEVIEKLS